MSQILVLISVLFSSSFFGQNQISTAYTLPVKNDYFRMDLNDLPKPTLSFDSRYVNTTNNQLSVYNSFSKNNDNYILQQGEYYALSPKLVLDNNWRGNKVDSFNPYGAPTIGSALVLGFITVLFDKK